MKTEKLLNKIENAGRITILDKDGKKLISMDAGEFLSAVSSGDCMEKLYSDIYEGHADVADIQKRAEKLGIREDTGRGLYLLEFEPGISSDIKEAAAELLRELFGSDKSTAVINEGSHSLILIHSVSSKKENGQLKENADKALSMLNTELMVKLRIAYGRVASSVYDLAGSYKEAVYAMEVMKLFYEERLVADYASLGIGGLINDISDEACERYLSECFGTKHRLHLDDEELQMVNRFFEKDLNISETARELYMHRNTLVYHLEKLQKKTGLDIRHFNDAVRLKLALMIESKASAGRNI